jgi:periplasmic divalent cation tolerance protein
MTPVVVLSTIPADLDPRPIARALVGARLAACVNVVPGLLSIYRWKGEISEDGEQLLLIKTSRERTDALREALVRLHPYEVPEFVVLEIDAIAASYRAWLLQSVAADGEEHGQAGERQQ